MSAVYTFNMLFNKVSIEIIVTRVFSLALFILCTVFVSHRGYECFKKYIEKPEAVDLGYKFTGSEEIPFPSFTFCPVKRYLLRFSACKKVL